MKQLRGFANEGVRESGKEYSGPKKMSSNYFENHQNYLEGMEKTFNFKVLPRFCTFLKAVFCEFGFKGCWG